MRKNLHYKVLASVLAIAGLYFYNAPTAWAEIKYDANQVTGDGTTQIIINNNKFKIDDTTSQLLNNEANVYGNYQTAENANGDENTINVTIQSSELDSVYGAHSENADANNNNVSITGDSSFSVVAGGSTGSGEATGNTVTINGNVTLKDSNVSYIAGGAGSGGSIVSDNHVIIEGGTVKGNIYGGYGHLNSNALIDKNDITITDSANVAGANLYGGYANNSSTATISNNTLTLNGWSGTVKSLNNFSDIYINNFTLNKNLIDVTGGVSGMENVKIHLGAFTGAIALTAGDYAEESDVAAAEIKWDEKLGSNVDFTIKDEDGKDVYAFADSLANYQIEDKFYIDDRSDGGGIYATKFADKLGYETGANSVSITAEVEKSVLAGKFIDENGKEHTNTQTPNPILTIGEGFTTKVGTVAGAYAVDKTDGTAQDAAGGVVNISGSTDWQGTVYAGYSESGAVNNNTITVDSRTQAEKMNLSGYNSVNQNNADNTLNITGNGSAFNSISNFETINFNDVALNSESALTVANADVDGTTINVNSLAGGQTFKAGDTLSLIDGTVTGEATLNSDKVTAGLSQDVFVDISNDNGLQLSVKEVQTNKQIDLVAENRAVAAAFINQGTDLISDSLDVISRDGNYGVKTFAAVQGNRSKYDVNSDIKINGWSTIVGVGNAAEFADGDEFSWGVFYENGSGNYRTFNEFNNEFFRGDGSLVYNGGGVAARYENAHGVYTEGSLRAGMLKSEMDNALSDGENKYGYSSESEYYGAHIGIGQIIPLTESSDLDVYGKFFHTYTEGDSFNVANDKFEFDSINSDRLRVGARITTNKANKFSTYYGLAYEYEFNGDAEMRAQNLAAPTQSLQGSSYMAEVGFNYQPTPDSPWNFDLNMRGYAGEREGATFNVQATYTF